MNDILYVIKYSGTFGYMKPWSANRDSKTKTNDFLTTSVLMGIEDKLFNELNVNDLKIKRHRLNFTNVCEQIETTTSINYSRVTKIKEPQYKKTTSIVSRLVLVNPVLYLCFSDYEFAKEAFTQHIVLGRNEDILLPELNFGISEITTFEFDNNFIYCGCESFISNSENEMALYCGLNKYTKEKQYLIKRVFGSQKN